MTIVPFEIRSHLIPFFFEEMQGTIASYNGQKVNMIRLYPTSSLANYIYSQIEYEKKAYPGVINHSFLLYLSIDKKNMTTLSGTIYKEMKGVKTELMMDICKVRAINNLLEDIFRTSMVCFVDGYRSAGKGITEAISVFSDKYQLEEYGFLQDSLRTLYNREKKNKLLSRVQKRSSNQVINFF